MIDNIHSIFAAAASQFTVDQFSAFTQLVSSNWSSEPVSMKEKLITLLAQIGKDTKNHELAHKVRRHCRKSAGYILVELSPSLRDKAGF